LEFLKKKPLFEQALDKSLTHFGEDNRLKEAVSYALKSGGKRFRPLLVLAVGEAVGECGVMEAALAVEYFHTASLIADDLPCMDNDAMRRGRPSLHVEFGEDVALLASYALITAAFEMIYRAGKGKDDTVVATALKEAASLAGIQGATGGQFYDLYPPELDCGGIARVHYLKTGTLFELSFLFGWLFGGGERERLDEVKVCARHFGSAFQICDDLRDLGEDGAMNICDILGEKRARALFHSEMEAFEKRLRALGLATPAMKGLLQALAQRLPLGAGS